MLHGVFDLEQAAKLLSTTTDEDVPFESTGHDAHMLWAANAGGPNEWHDGVASYGDVQGWKKALWVILTRETCFDSSRALSEFSWAAGVVVEMNITLSITTG